MRIGTTPTHTFTLPAEIVSDSQKVRVVYSQGNEVILAKGASVVGSDAIVKLTQEETLKFSHKLRVEIQLRVLLGNGDALTSDIIIKKPYECLENGVFA